MKIAIIGLGKMGMQIVHKLVEDGHEVVAYNRSPEQITVAQKLGATPATTREAVVAAFADEQLTAWLMIPSDAVDAELNAWLAIVPKGSVIVDGGNSDFRKTQQRAAKVAENGSVLLDVGTSGGILGLKAGFSMMVGGDDAGALKLAPALNTLSKPSGAWKHFGPSGSGHFVKMVHNAIEYGFMESLAEGYRVLKEGPYEHIDLGAAGEVWQHGSVITSTLNGLVAEALADNPTLDGVDGYVAESGEARWTLEVAQAAQIAMPSIQASFAVRVASQKGETNFATKVLAATRNKFGGHAINKVTDK